MPQMITSDSNPSVKLYRKLVSAKKYRSEYNMFPLEGLRLVKDAAEENAELHCVMITESCMKKLSERSDALDFLPEKTRENALVITDSIGEKLASTDGTQGIFAICRTPALPSLSDTVNADGRYIMLHSIQDPGNMGTVIRTADAMGVSAVIACGCCDIFSPKTVRSTMGSLFRMKLCIASEDEAFEEFAAKRIKTYAAVIDKDALSLTDCSFSDGSAVLIGNEGNGLPEETAMRCSERLTIRMHGSVNSLNAATAASIIMWELTK